MEMRGEIHDPAVLPTGEEPSVIITQGGGWNPRPVWTLLSIKKIAFLCRE
jgi:hypothetical protein